MPSPQNRFQIRNLHTNIRRSRIIDHTHLGNQNQDLRINGD